MKTLIEMSPEHYDHFVAKCDVASREYSILMSGVVRNQESRDRGEIEIVCDREEAVRLLEAASRLCPEAAPVIKAGLDLAHEL